MELSHNFELGILCSDCRHTQVEFFSINQELFSYLNCLKYSKKIELVNMAAAERAIVFLERYLKFHIPDFKGIQSFQIYK